MPGEGRERAESNSSGVSQTASSNGSVKSKRVKQGGGNHTKSKMRPVTVETVRRIVAQEGRSARNLISWNAPLDMEDKPKPGIAEMKMSGKRPGNPSIKRRSKSYDTGTLEKKKSAELKSNSDIKNLAGGTQSSSVKRQVSIRARYWAYLFDNLRRAVDEIYATCETDQSVVECKEVLLVLDNYRHEFQALIDWINLEERLNSTDIANRPTSLAWEVRKSSPGRPRQRMTPRGGHPGGIGLPEPVQAVARSTPDSGTQPSSSIKRTNSDKKTGSSSTTVTWADKVKGIQGNGNGHKQKRSPRSQNRKVIPSPSQKHSKSSTVNKTPDVDDGDDEAGWEKVSSRSKQAKSRNKIASTKAKSGSVDENHNVTKIATFSEESTDTSSPVARMTLKDGNPDFSGIVVERSMGTSTSLSSYPDSSKATEPLDQALFEDGDSSNENDISLQTLDEVEAEFFKTDNALGSEDDDSSVLASMDTDSKANVALREHEASIAAAEQEEQQLMKEIEAEENAPCDTDPETANDMETPSVSSANVTPRENSDWSSIMARFEADQELHRGMTWGDMIDEEELREPGRAVQMHEKLSSPSRKRTPAESKRKMEEKQRSATLRRQKMVQDKTERIHILTERVADVRRLKDDLIMGRTELLKELHIEKLQRAEQQRALKLMKIVQKAQAEETKVNEILFINELQEQNKRHDVLNRILEHDARLQELQQERSKMFEVKAAKEETVKERRRLLEKERQDRLSDLINKRKEHDSRIEQLKQEREKEREKQAREKERDRKTRLSALNAAQQEAVEELLKKIQIKHDESERRHQEQLEQRKEKALELSLGRFSLSSSGNMQPGELQNSICEGEKVAKTSGSTNTQIDLSSLPTVDDRDTSKGDGVNACKSTSSDNSSSVISPRNAPSAEEKRIAKERETRMIERKKAMKKRAKKLKTRMAARGREFLKVLDEKSTRSTNAKSKVARLLKDIGRQLNSQKEASGPWVANRVAAVDRALGELNRLLEKKDVETKSSFRICGGFETLEQILELPLNSTLQYLKGESVCIVPDKTIANVASTLKSACEDNYENLMYMLYACRFTTLIDALSNQLIKNLPEEGGVSSTSVKSPGASRRPSASGNKNSDPDSLFNPAASALLDAVAFSIGQLASHPPVKDDGKLRISDNKQLLRALKSTFVTVNKPPSIDIDPKKFSESFLNRGLDIVSYVVSCGVLDKLSVYLNSVRSEIEANSKAASFIKNGLSFLYAITEFVASRNRSLVDNTEGRSRRVSTGSNASGAGGEKSISVTKSVLPGAIDQSWDSDPTQLLPTLFHTEVMGVVSVLYGILLHGAPERPILLRNNSMAALDDVMGSEPPREIPRHVLEIAMSVMLVLNAVADLDIHLLQESLGAEGVSLEFRHICAYLLWYCQHGDRERLLHEVIICVGHFALCNKKNQGIVHSGAMPTVLQQLCVLPFAYFSNPRLSSILFPTLIACCHDNPANLAMLEQEASSSLLSNYVKGILDEKESDTDATKSQRKSENLKRRNSVTLSSNRLYTVPFLRDAVRFFSDTNGRKLPDSTNAGVSNMESS